MYKKYIFLTYVVLSSTIALHADSHDTTAKKRKIDRAASPQAKEEPKSKDTKLVWGGIAVATATLGVFIAIRHNASASLAQPQNPPDKLSRTASATNKILKFLPEEQKVIKSYPKIEENRQTGSYLQEKAVYEALWAQDNTYIMKSTFNDQEKTITQDYHEDYINMEKYLEERGQKMNEFRGTIKMPLACLLAIDQIYETAAKVMLNPGGDLGHGMRFADIVNTNPKGEPQWKLVDFDFGHNQHDPTKTPKAYKAYISRHLAPDGNTLTLQGATLEDIKKRRKKDGKNYWFSIYIMGGDIETLEPIVPRL